VNGGCAVYPADPQRQGHHVPFVINSATLMIAARVGWQRRCLPADEHRCTG